METAAQQHSLSGPSSSVRIGTKLWDRWPQKWHGCKFFSSSVCPTPLWDPCSLFSNGIWSSLPL